jgi:hypothetical protein
LGEVNGVAPLLHWDQSHLHVGQSVSVDVADMAQHLIDLLHNPTLRAEMGRRGRKRAEALYAWPVVVQQWEALWAELASIAGSLPVQPPGGLDYVQPNYFQHFAHYASRIIGDSTSLRLTARGQAVLAGRAPFYLHPWSRGFLQPQYLRAGLSALQRVEGSVATLPVGAVVESLQSCGLTRDRALMHLMWLAKYNLVSLGEATLSDRGAGG